MAEKTTSDEIAAIAARILAGGDPMDNQQVRIAIQSAVANGVRCTSPSAVVRIVVPDTVVDAIGHVLKPYFDNMLLIAASAVAQADGK